MTSYCISGQVDLVNKGSTIQGKNLLQKEQILFLKSWPLLRKDAKCKVTDLLPLKAYPFASPESVSISLGSIHQGV